MMLTKTLQTFSATSALLLFVGVLQTENTSANGYDSAIRSFLLTVAAIVGFIVLVITLVKKRSAIRRYVVNLVNTVDKNNLDSTNLVNNKLDKGESNK